MDYNGNPSSISLTNVDDTKPNSLFYQSPFALLACQTHVAFVVCLPSSVCAYLKYQRTEKGQFYLIFGTRTLNGVEPIPNRYTRVPWRWGFGADAVRFALSFPYAQAYGNLWLVPVTLGNEFS